MRVHICIAAMLMGSLLISPNSPAQSGWKPDTIKIGTISNLWDVKFIDENRGVVVGDTAVKTTDGGKTWQPLGIAIGFNGEIEGGFHEVVLDGKGLSSGTYLYRLRVDNIVQAKKLLIVR